MERASPTETRQAMQTASEYAKFGIPFIPMPVRNGTEREATIAEAIARLEQEYVESVSDE